MTKKPTTKLTGRSKLRRVTAAGAGGWKKLFIDALRQMPNITVACDTAHISRATAYDARERSKTFARRWDAACISGRERLEAYLWRRATVGLKRGVWMKDKDGNPVKVEEIAEVSDTVGLRLLAAHWPEKYGLQKEGISATATLPDGTSMSMTVVQSPIDPEEVTGPAPVGLLKE